MYVYKLAFPSRTCNIILAHSVATYKYPSGVKTKKTCLRFNKSINKTRFR